MKAKALLCASVATLALVGLSPAAAQTAQEAPKPEAATNQSVDPASPDPATQGAWWQAAIANWHAMRPAADGQSMIRTRTRGDEQSLCGEAPHTLRSIVYPLCPHQSILRSRLQP